LSYDSQNADYSILSALYIIDLQSGWLSPSASQA